VDAHPNFTKRMTPKDKAKELVDKFTVVGLQQRNEGIQCALICIDEMLELIPEMAFGNRYYEYLKEVKNEIELI
jgi:hypothetical protein